MSAFWMVDPDVTDADAPDGVARIVADTHIAWIVLPREKMTIARRLWYLLQSLLHLLARLVAGVTRRR